MLTAMASYRPSRELRIVKPCGERWEEMPGDSRVRHCSVCEHDVLNTAAMTPEQIEAILSKPGPLPCMRMVHHEDGSLLTADTARGPMRLARIAAAALTATIALTSVSAQTASHAKSIVISGRVVDATGAPLAHSTVTIRSEAGFFKSMETNSSGEFRFDVQDDGSYTLNALALGFVPSRSTILIPNDAQSVSRDIALQAGSINLGAPIIVSAGETNLPVEPSHLDSYLQAPATAQARKVKRTHPSVQHPATKHDSKSTTSSQ